MKVDSVNPATGSVIRSFKAARPEGVRAAVEHAAIAQRQWAAMPFAKREKLFRSLAQVIKSRAEEVLQTIKQETGKTIADGEAEVYDVIDGIDYYLGKFKAVTAGDIELDAKAFPHTVAQISYQPYGVVGLIMPWNFPFYSPIMLALAALVAGNAVVLKPSEYATMNALLIQSLFAEAGFPNYVLQVLPGADETGRHLAGSSVDKLFFIGSVEAGKDVIAHAGVTPVQVELGGNSAALVLADADLDLAAAGVAWGGTYLSGQDCVGIKRVFVVESVAQAFLSKLITIVEGLRPEIDYGPYITRAAMEEVKRRLDDAVAHGAMLHCGGDILSLHDGQGNWLAPSVLTYTDPSLELVAQETFGNVVPVMIVKNTEEAIKQANATDYGLSNVIFSRDAATARQIAGRLESGMVFVNDPVIAVPGCDHWTGWKQSGFGTTESKLMQCLKKKLVSVNRSATKRSFWYPYEEV